MLVLPANNAHTDRWPKLAGYGAEKACAAWPLLLHLTASQIEVGKQKEFALLTGELFMTAPDNPP
jgi:hypothetical protein